MKKIFFVAALVGAIAGGILFYLYSTDPLLDDAGEEEDFGHLL